jgi:hypothetical protein
MNDGTLLYCTHCLSESGKHPVLGRLLISGGVLVMRYHVGTTILQASNITLSCGCGFSYYLTGNSIDGTAMLNV